MYVLGWKDRNNQPGRPTHCLDRFQTVFPAKCTTRNFPAEVIRCSKWRKRLRKNTNISIITLHKEMAIGYDSTWTTWKCLERLRTANTCSKIQQQKLKFYTGDTTYACGRAEEPRHTCYSAPNLHSPVLWITSLRSMM